MGQVKEVSKSKGITLDYSNSQWSGQKSKGKEGKFEKILNSAINKRLDKTGFPKSYEIKKIEFSFKYNFAGIKNTGLPYIIFQKAYQQPIIVA